MRDILIFLIGLLVGATIGYFGESFIQPHLSAYSFPTTLSLTLTSNTTIFTIGSSATFKAELDFTLPSELSSLEPQIRQYVLKDKKIILMFKTTETSYWSIVEAKNTIYINRGEATFTYMFSNVGTFEFKAVFEGDNLLKSSESQTVTVNVS